MIYEHDLDEQWVWHYTGDPSGPTRTFRVTAFALDPPTGNDPGGGRLWIASGGELPDVDRSIDVVAPKGRLHRIKLSERAPQGWYPWTNTGQASLA